MTTGVAYNGLNEPLPWESESPTKATVGRHGRWSPQEMKAKLSEWATEARERKIAVADGMDPDFQFAIDLFSNVPKSQ